MRSIRTLFLGITLFCVSVGTAMLIQGCKTSLDSSGPYAQPGGGGMFLFTVDKTLVDSKDVMNAFVTWEYKNHAAVLSNWPAVTQAADSIRTHAPQWFSDAELLRTAYVMTPSDITSNKLNGQVQMIKTVAITTGPMTNNIH